MDKGARAEALPTTEDFRGSFSGNERDVFFYNPDGDHRFAELGYSLGLDFADDGRAFIPVDVDGDGDLDLVTTSLQRLRLLENRQPQRHFARVLLKATKTQHHALGAEVTVSAGGVEQWDYVKLTAGFQTQVPLELHFGLGDAERIDAITVQWPSGARQRHEGLLADRRITITEGAEPVVTEVAAWPQASRPRALGSFALDAPAADLGGTSAPLAAPGKPTLINFWAPWCAPCKEELPVLAKLAKAHGDAVRFVGVSVETKDIASVEAAVKAYGLSYDQRLANDPLMVSFFGSDGEAPLPSTFVFGADGKVERVFYRRVAEADLAPVLAGVTAESFDEALAVELIDQHLARKELEAAVVLLRRAVAARGQSPLLWAKLGNTLGLLGQVEEAEAALGQAVTLEPKHAYGWYALGVLRKQRGSLGPAAEAFERAAAHAPDKPEYLTSLGAAYSRVRKFDAAVGTFERLVRLQPSSAPAWLNLGKARALAKRPDAKAAFIKAAALDPSNREAQALLRQFQ